MKSGELRGRGLPGAAGAMVRLGAVVAALAAGQAARSQSPPPTTTAPAGGTTTSAPANQPSPEALAVLKNLEAAGPKFPNVVADLKYREVLGEKGDIQQFTGKVYFQGESKDSAGRFRIHFDTVKQGLDEKVAPLANLEDYVFDGQWLIVAKDRPKQQTSYQLAPAGQKIDALQLGKGPFPVPFGQKVENVLKYYAATTRPPKDGDPPGADYIKLVARPEATDIEAKTLEMWVQRTTGLPEKVLAEDRHENLKTVLFSAIKMPEKLDAETFTLPKRGSEWTVRVEPFRK